MLVSVQRFALGQARAKGAAGTRRSAVAAWSWLVGCSIALGVLAGGRAQAKEPSRHQYEAATFMAPQSDLTEPYPGPGVSPPPMDFSEQTIRQTARIAVGGTALKFVFSNQFGTEPVTLDRVQVALSLGLGAVDPATSKAVTFGGKRAVTLPPGREIYSDAIPFPAKALSDIAVSLYVRHAHFRTGNRISATTAYVARGDQTGRVRMTDPQPLHTTYAMPKIVAVRAAKTRVLVAFGDSITAGALPDTHSSWPDLLAVLFHARSENFSAVNAGIGGNRWVRSNMGPCGLCRMQRDLFETEGATDVVFALGVNDLGLGLRFANGFKDPAETVTAEQIIDTMKTAISRAKARGLKVYVATIVPFRPRGADDYKSDYYTSGRPDQVPYGAKQPLNGEQMRQEINAFIRNNRSIDGVIDWDRAVADPKEPLVQSKEFTLEGLHPNERGSALYAQLAYEAVFGVPQN